MDLDEAREFIASCPWRQVAGEPEGPLNLPPDPHQYVILGWPEVDKQQLGHFVKLIQDTGYSGRYSPPYDPERSMVNRYLEVDEWVYWYIWPKMLNRQLAEDRQHEIIDTRTGELS